MCVSAVNSQEEDIGQFEPVDPLEESTTSLVSSTSAYSSFPVDVVVYVRVQVTYLKLHALLWLAKLMSLCSPLYNMSVLNEYVLLSQCPDPETPHSNE